MIYILIASFVLGFLWLYGAYVYRSREESAEAKSYSERKVQLEHAIENARAELRRHKEAETTRLEKSYHERTAAELNRMKTDMQTEMRQRRKELDDEFAVKERDLRGELADALEEGRTEFQATIEKVDKMLGERLAEVRERNTVRFNCVCSPAAEDGIDVEIDFTKDNFFTCPKCGARYRVGITLSPILMSGVTNNRRIAGIFDGENPRKGRTPKKG